MKKKFIVGFFLLLILIANFSFASYSTVTMEVVEEPVCSIEFGENSGFEKRLIEKNLNNKEVTIQLQVTNQEEATKTTGEIMLVLDNSDSMLNEVGDQTRKDLVFESAKILVSSLLEDNQNLQIGIVSFSSSTTQSEEGTLADANLVSGLTNDTTTLTNAISSIEANGPRTDLDAGLTLAQQQFSEEANNKYMIVLTDGVPNIALNHSNSYYSDEVIAATKAKLESLDNSGIALTIMLTGITDENYTPIPGSKTYGEIIEEIFGTVENPTAGHFYYVTDNQIEDTITNDIYQSLIPISHSYTDITIVDYFPQEIVDNFEFAYVTEANIGNISAQIDPTNNSITWTIPELASGQTATVQYKLKLKEDFDENIVGQILDTNEKVDITYKDFDNTDQSKTSDVTPKLKLSEPPASLPAAGMKTFFIALIVVAGGLLVFSLIKLTILNRNMK